MVLFSSSQTFSPGSYIGVDQTEPHPKSANQDMTYCAIRSCAPKSLWEGCIFNTPRSTGDKAAGPGQIKGGNAFDQPNGAHGDQVLLVGWG